jgi:hypothetical protein
MDIGVHRIRDRIRVMSHVVPSGWVSNCHTQDVSPSWRDHFVSRPWVDQSYWVLRRERAFFAPN